MGKARYALPIATALGSLLLLYADPTTPQSFTFHARDPGVRTGPPGAGGPVPGLTASQLVFFNAGLADFAEAEPASDGLGPTMNLDSCAGCHAQPAVGGSSPLVNPQVTFATKAGAHNAVPSFVRINGPVREARFVKNADGSADGGVHALFTITGRSDAAGCTLSQPDFQTALANKNVIFRIPTPVFGSGLIEAIPDYVIAANGAANTASKQPLGIGGHANVTFAGRTVSGASNNNGNDGTIARFGWKAQNKSLLLFSGEAYNVEMGISNEIFPTEREENTACQFAATPNDEMDMDTPVNTEVISAIQRFAVFQRLLAAPAPSPNNPGGSDSIARGKQYFASIGCALCHTPTLKTGNSAILALRNQNANLYSDLMVHDMGVGLADGVAQGQASGREFRTAPLWGLGQRVFFLHDGRSSDLLDAIGEHQSGSRTQGTASEANGVVGNFNGLSEHQKQDILNFLRSL